MKHDHNWSPAEALMNHVQELERLEDLRKQAAESVKDGFRRASMDGFDADTLKVVLKLRKLPPAAVAERRALENTYLVALGMLTESLSDESRRRLDEEQRRQRGEDPAPPSGEKPADGAPDTPPGTTPDTPADQVKQPTFQFKTPEEALEEGRQAGREGKSIWDNPYKDPQRDAAQRANWDRGWCQETKSNGMELNKAWGRRTTDKKPDEPPGDNGEPADREREMEDA